MAPPTDKLAHLKDREQITLNAIAAWKEQNRRYAQLSVNGGDPAILEAQRLDAVSAYEAMLDSVTCERGALTLLHEANEAAPKKKPPPKDGKNKPKENG
jgi:hypothetical protein